MNIDNYRIIRTKLYSNIAKEILQSVEGQLSDGMWENSPAMEKYWMFSRIETAPDGEIVIKISGDEWNHRCRNGFYHMSDDEIIEWFAAKAKRVMQVELNDENIKNGWKRDNDKFKTRYLSYEEEITVSDVYFVYDFLTGRDIATRYDGGMSQKIISAARSADDTRKEEIRRKKLDEIAAEQAKAVDELNAEERELIEKIKADFIAKRRQLNENYMKLREKLG